MTSSWSAKLFSVSRYSAAICPIGFLALVNLLTAPRTIWVQWAAIPWALVLALHGLRVFDKIPFLNADWEKRTVEKYLGRKL